MKGRFAVLLTLMIVMLAGTALGYRYADSDPHRQYFAEHSKPTAIRVYVDLDPHTRYDHLGTRNGPSRDYSCQRDYVQYRRCPARSFFTETFDPTRNYVQYEDGSARFYHNKRSDNIEGIRTYTYSRHKPLVKDPVSKKSYSDIVFTGSSKHAKSGLHAYDN